MLADANRLGGGRDQTVFGQSLEQGHAHMFFLDSDDVGASQRLKERCRLGIVITGNHGAQTGDAVRAFARVGNKGEVVTHFPARQSQHSCQLAASGDGNLHQSTA